MAESLPAHDAASSTRPRIIVGVDGSPGSVEALRQAGLLVTSFSGSVEAVFVWQFPATVIGVFPSEWSPEDDAKTILDGAVREVFGAVPPSWVQQTTVEGAPTRALIELSEDADLLVVGSRGHGGFAGLLLGSVSSACAEYAHCPVLIIHGDRLFGAKA